MHVIKNCFDSHLHFLATGEVASGLKLNALKSADEILDVKLQPEYLRANWLQGFGWDNNKWPTSKLPTKDLLDKAFPDHPAILSRVDGHASWVNSEAIVELKKLGYDFSVSPIGGSIEKDSNGQPSGVLVDQAHINALKRLPQFTDQQMTGFLLKSQSLFNRAGFTHVRDLSMNFKTWNLLLDLFNKKELTVCIDSFITVEPDGNLDENLMETFQQIQLMKQNPCPYLRIKGIKFFVDGSLGSKTAYLSENYLNSTISGLKIWNDEQVKKAISFAWKNQLEVAVHTIGDQAVHDVVTTARAVSALGILGRLHLEHVQIIRPETIQLMKPLHITCHMQPCHWLSDQAWLSKALPKSLLKNIFPWEALRKNKIAFDFGSDSPIEPPSLLRTREALEKSVATMPKLNDDWQKYHAHQDSNWTNSWTEFTDESIQQVYFNSEPLL